MSNSNGSVKVEQNHTKSTSTTYNENTWVGPLKARLQSLKSSSVLSHTSRHLCGSIACFDYFHMATPFFSLFMLQCLYVGLYQTRLNIFVHREMPHLDSFQKSFPKTKILNKEIQKLLFPVTCIERAKHECNNMVETNMYRRVGSSLPAQE